LGFTRGRELGVDIEQVRADIAAVEIAKRYFSTKENAVLRALPKHLQVEAFFNCWTRKEAFIKAIGEGVSCRLDRFDVTLVPGEAGQILKSRLKDHPASRWSLISLDAGDDFKAALVVEKGDWKLQCWRWDNQH
jgi:4'-phosphopantetheinyl transferase